MSALLADCRHALRLYVRTPGASLLAVAALAIGMAFFCAFLSLYVDLVLRPHPGFEQSSRIMTIGQNTGTNLSGITYEAVERIDDEMNSLEAAAMFTNTTVTLIAEEEQARAAMVSEGFFSGLRPRMALGRGFLDEEHEPDAEPVVVISYRYWQQQFDGDRDVIDRSIEIAPAPSSSLLFALTGRAAAEEEEEESTHFRIVGVMAEELPGVFVSSASEFNAPVVWLPIERAWTLFGNESEQLPRQSTAGTLARRVSGATTTAVVNELRARYGNDPALWNGGVGRQLDAIDGVVQNSVVQKDMKRQLEMFLAGSILLALVAAANVSLFLLARAPGRRRELGIRMAVGAPLGRLARQLATEAGLLVVIAATLGLVGSIWLSLWLKDLSFLRAAEWSDVRLLDWRVLSLAGLFLMILTALVSLAPIPGLKRLGIAAASKQVAARASLAQRLAGSTQIAISGTFGGAAIAFALYLGSMLLGDPGYAIEGRYNVQFSINLQDAINEDGFIRLETLNIESARQRELFEAEPGVTAISFASVAPGTQSTMSTQQIRDPENSAEQISIGRANIDPEFVDVLELRLRYGRAPTENETGVALVNEALAQRFFGRDNVVGESLEIRSDAGETAEIVGVLEDLSFVHPAADVEPIAFLNVPASSLTLRALFESTLTATELESRLNALIESSELSFTNANVTPLKTLRRNLIAADTARSLLTIGTASLVVLLATIGFYGTQAYLVAAGRREYAIRAALGAGPHSLRRLVLLRGLMMGLPGLVIGGLLAFIAVAWLRDGYVSRDVSPGLVSIGVVIGLCVLLLAASAGPARRAMRTQPATLLRQD